MENNTPDTNNFLNWVEIKNFKSIKDLRLDCKRVNVFIGKPNVGKSNILEGLGLLGAGYSTDKFLDGFIRYKDLKQLFFDNDWEKIVRINSNKGTVIVMASNTNETDFYYYATPEQYSESIIIHSKIKDIVSDSGGIIYGLRRNGEYRSIKDGAKFDESIYKKYDFKNIDSFPDNFRTFLLPPSGSNLFSVVDKIGNLKEEFGKLFGQQGLDFVLSPDEQLFELQRKKDYYVIKYPFETAR